MDAFTREPELITREADILITGAGVPNLVGGSWLKPGAVVLDVGTCPVDVSILLDPLTLSYHIFTFSFGAGSD